MPAKKRSRRARRAGKRKRAHPSVRAGPRPLRGPPLKREERAGPAPEPQTEVVGAATDFGERYAYVYSDLRRIGALAGAIFLVLIILSFILK